MKQRIFELLNGFQEDFDCEIEEIVDFVNEKEEEIQKLKSKIEDLEEENTRILISPMIADKN